MRRGGGGSGTPVVGTTSSPTLATAKYAGTWKTACFLGVNGTIQTSTGLTAYQTRSLAYTPVNASLSNVVWIDTYYLPTDSACAQASIGNVTRPNTNTQSIDGTTVIGTNTVDQITLVVAQPFPGITYGGTYSVNGLTFAASFNQARSDKSLALISGTTLTFGGSAPLDANGYPTTLGTSANLILTKQ